jgi:hypothetical protein
MTKDVIELAREAGLVERDHDNIEVVTLDDLPKLAALVAARERERCAKACEAVAASWSFHMVAPSAAMNCADRIRALNTEGEGNDRP